MVWMVVTLFLLDGAAFLRGQENAAELPDSALAESPVADAETPMGHVPEWYTDGTGFVEATGMLFVKTEASCMNPQQANDELQRKSLEEVSRIVDRWHGKGAASRLGLDAKYVMENLVFDRHIAFAVDDDPELIRLSMEHNLAGQKQYFVGYAQLHLGDTFRDYVRARMEDRQTAGRLIGVGLSGGAFLAFLAVLLGYLKMDTATRGFYSRRLQTVTLVAVILIVAATWWLRTAIVWP